MSTSTLITAIRQAMPATSAHIYLNTGTFGPIPNCVPEAIQQQLHREWQQGRLGSETFQNIAAIYTSARQAVARLLNAEEDEIALTDNTGEGLNLIAYGFNWQPGDEIITTNHEHISALAPLYQLRDRFGVVIRSADLGPLANRSLNEALAPLITSRTRLLVLSHVTWTTGAVLDIQAACQLAHAQQIPVLIDGAQSAGNIAIDVKALEVDFYAIPMQKWLCGPDGTGAIYIRRKSLDLLTSTYVGYYSLQRDEGGELLFHPNARRFESGGRQTAAIAGQAAALNWLETFVGYTWLFARIATLNRYAYQTLKEIPNLSIITPQPGTCGILSLKLEGRDDAEVVKQLSQTHNIAIRNIPPTGLLRISTGFYNTEEEIDSLAQALRTI